MTAFHPLRCVREFTHIISASPEEIFPLLCPVREHDWIDGWACQVVYSESGVAENNCVFETCFDHLGRGVWSVTRYEPDTGRIQFSIVYPATHVEKLEVRVTPADGGRSRVHWHRTYTGLNSDGNRLIEAFTEAALEEIMEWLGRSLEHYCTTGTLLKKT